MVGLSRSGNCGMLPQAVSLVGGRSTKIDGRGTGEAAVQGSGQQKIRSGALTRWKGRTGMNERVREDIASPAVLTRPNVAAGSNGVSQKEQISSRIRVARLLCIHIRIGGFSPLEGDLVTSGM